MKKLVLFLVGLSLSTSVAKAQDDDKDIRDRLVLGLRAGINRSNVYDATGQNFKADGKTGFAGGAFIGIPIGKFLGFQPEILISQKGYQSSGNLLNIPYSDARTTTFVDVPLQLQIKPIEFLTLLVGVQYSYLIHQKDVYVFGPNSSAQDQEFKNDNARKNIFGAVLGLDIHVNHFVLSGRACWDLQNNSGTGSSYTPRYKNVWLQATIGYRIFS